MQSVKNLAGPGSIRAYGQRLGETSGQVLVRKLVSADLLSRKWGDYGGLEVLGSPVADVQLVNGRYSRRYSAGTLQMVAGEATLEQQKAFRATVTVAGLECVQRAKTDQVGGPSSEPYLIITAVDTAMAQGKAVSALHGPYEDTNGGDWEPIGGTALWQGANPQNLQIEMVIYEEDGGQSQEIRRKVQNTINDALLVGGIIFPAVGVALKALGSVKDRIVKGVSNTVKELFKDDYVGRGVLSLTYHDFVTDLRPVKVKEGQKYRDVVQVDGGDAGIYKVYLWWEAEPLIVPPR